MSNEIIEIYSDLEKEIKNEDAVEMQLANLVSIEKSDKTRILYELIELSIDDPDQEKRYKTIGSLNKTRPLKSTRLENELRRVEETFRKPLIGKKLSEAFNRKNPSGSVVTEVETARLHKLINNIFDYLVIIPITFLICLTYCAVFEQEYMNSAFSFWQWTNEETLLFISNFIPMLYFTSISYFGFFFLLLKKTIANVFLGYELKTFQGNKPKSSQILTRIACLPLSFIPFFEKSLPDFVSGTELKRL